MSDDRRWTIRVCNGDVCSECSELTACAHSKLIEVIPKDAQGVPLATHKQIVTLLAHAGVALEVVTAVEDGANLKAFTDTFIAQMRATRDQIRVALAEFERTTNHNEGTR